MLKVQSGFGSYSVNDIDAAKAFYRKLGLEVKDTPMGVIEVMVGPDQHVTVYPKPNHQPATFTVLHLIVPDIEAAVDDLAEMGIAMEQYEMPGMKQDAKGIARDPQGPAIAWFLDPAGNTIAVIGEA